MKQKEIKKVVRERYGSIAREEGSCCAPSASCCTGASVAGRSAKE